MVLLQVLIKLSALKFATPVASNFHNAYVVLSTKPCIEVLVVVEGLVFGLDKINFGELAASICETDKIFLLIDSFH